MTLAEDTGHSRGSGRGLGSDLKDNSEHFNLMSMGENITWILQMVVGVRVHSFIHPLIHSFIPCGNVSVPALLVAEGTGTQQTDHAFLGPEGIQTPTHTVP